MMRSILAGMAALVLNAVPALADGKVYVQLPDLSSYTDRAAEDFLYQLVLANVVSSNCAGFAVTDAEWSLLTDSADLIAYGQLKLDTGTYDDGYYKPAFDALDEAGTCEAEGLAVEGILDELVAHGGSREPLADQDGAYEYWRALMDRLQAEANAAPAPGKSKVKVK